MVFLFFDFDVFDDVFKIDDFIKFFFLGYIVESINLKYVFVLLI